MHTYLIETYGCQMNVAESNAIELLLKGRGMEAVTEPQMADLVIINTCSVRKTAENRIWGRLGFYSAIKKKTPVMDYLKKRYSQLLGKYLLVLILMHIIKGCIAAYGGTFSFIDALTSLLPECLLLQNIGVFHSTGYLFPTWYLSVLIYGGTFILLLHNNLGSKWGG